MTQKDAEPVKAADVIEVLIAYKARIVDEASGANEHITGTEAGGDGPEIGQIGTRTEGAVIAACTSDKCGLGIGCLRTKTPRDGAVGSLQPTWLGLNATRGRGKVGVARIQSTPSTMRCSCHCPRHS